jgi:undecaprenyl diphosphate synthase
LDEAGLAALLDRRRLPRHIAIILDGNGRWAATYDLPRILGHRQGAKSVREIVVLSRELGIEVLSLYAFSSENWNRPKGEVTQLMVLLSRYLKNELRTMMKNGVRLRTVGQIERLPAPVVRLIRDVEAQTAENQNMTLVLALSYSGRAEIVDAAKRLAEGVAKGEIALEEISEAQFTDYLYAPDLPDPDLLIRTSGEVRVSNFFLWQMAYTEFYFTETLWPNFGRRDFLAALLDYQGRERRFGRVSGTHAPSRTDEKKA